MKLSETALILIGYQNDYFAPDGVLYGVVEEPSRVTDVVANTLDLIARLAPTPTPMIATPIFFTADYSELQQPVGILKLIKEAGAFRQGTVGSQMIAPLRRFGDRILEVPGKRGLNAFSNTQLDEVLQQRGVRHVVLAGTCTSICIDSTGRSAHERGYSVSVLSDCTSARTVFEQEFYCQQILPLYATVLDHHQLLKMLGVER